MYLNLRRFLKKLDNPLNNDQLLREAIKGYSERNHRYLSFYGIENKESNIDQKSQEEFELYIFYKWKENILNSLEKYPEDTIKNTNRDEIVIKTSLEKLIELFNPKTLEDINKIFDENSDIYSIYDKSMNFIIDNIYTTPGKTNWRYFSSYIINQNEEKQMEPKHKLLINVDTKYLYKFALLFIKKCEEMNLPYDFNLIDFLNITNQFEINSDTKHLYKYIELLEKLEEENQIDFNNIKEPPILSSHIDNWIGYISNTKNINSASNYDHSEARVVMFNTVLNKFNKAWTKNHINKDVVINNKRMSYKEFLSDLLYKEILIELNNELDSNKEVTRITKDDLESPILTKTIKKMISQNINYILENITDIENINENKLSEVNTRNENEVITTNKNIIKKAISRQPYILSKENNEFIEQFRNKIKIECKRFGILENKISLDNKVYEELLEKEEKDRIELHERLEKYTKQKVQIKYKRKR